MSYRSIVPFLAFTLAVGTGSALPAAAAGAPLTTTEVCVDATTYHVCARSRLVRTSGGRPVVQIYRRSTVVAPVTAVGLRAEMHLLTPRGRVVPGMLRSERAVFLHAYAPHVNWIDDADAGTAPCAMSGTSAFGPISIGRRENGKRVEFYATRAAFVPPPGCTAGPATTNPDGDWDEAHRTGAMRIAVGRRSVDLVSDVPFPIATPEISGD